jgi:hypothetical protein
MEVKPFYKFEYEAHIKTKSIFEISAKVLVFKGQNIVENEKCKICKFWLALSPGSRKMKTLSLYSFMSFAQKSNISTVLACT